MNDAAEKESCTQKLLDLDLFPVFLTEVCSLHSILSRVTFGKTCASNETSCTYGCFAWTMFVS